MRRTAGLVLAVGACAAVVRGAPQTFLVRAQRVYTVSGEVLAPGMVLVQDGKIVEVKAEIAAPEGAAVHTAPVVVPGFIDADGLAGMRSPFNEESSEVTPRVRASVLFDARAPELARLRAQGVTAMRISPGLRNVVGGLCAVVKTYGHSGADAVLREDASLQAVLSAEATRGNRSRGWGAPADMFHRRPTTRMAVIAMFRETFDRAREVREGTRQATPDLRQLGEVLEGALPLHVFAASAIDIRVAVGESVRLGYTPVVLGGLEAYKEAASLAQRAIPVVLTPEAIGVRERGVAGDVRLDNAAVLVAGGVAIALATGGADVEPLFLGRMAVRHGLAEDQALRALTLAPARILGIDGERGSIEPGKAADLVLLSAPPFARGARVLQVFGEGARIFPEGADR